MAYKKPVIKGELGVFTGTSDFFNSLLKLPDVDHYVGQSKNIPERWLTYLQSGYDKKLHKNCLDRVKDFKKKTLILRLLDYGIKNKASLDTAEQCFVARYQPTLNIQLRDSTLDSCCIPLKRGKGKDTSGIYQLIVVPKAVIDSINHDSLYLPDVQKFIKLSLKTDPNVNRGFICKKPLKFSVFKDVNYYGLNFD
jgi:hypothetical protein